jgi:hypothetical protein
LSPQIISNPIDLNQSKKVELSLEHFDEDVEQTIEEAGFEEAKNAGPSRFNGASFLSGDDSFNNVVK